MQEYWVNVYRDGTIGRKWEFKQYCIKAGNYDNMLGFKLAYRIHVKLKPVIKYRENW